ncbi:hypothetical protein PPS11_26996 [Pseudomonas putida S11]|nr:hypothetical protein PPS11_26996 [Pseudomonas putida S11]
MVLAELASGVAFGLERLGDGDIAGLQARPVTPVACPRLDRPVRRAVCPVMKVERPAVQLFSA